MLSNVLTVAELAALSRRKRKSNLSRIIPTDQLESYIEQGWTRAGRKRRKGVRIVRPKPVSETLEDRVWTVLYRMGFAVMSGEGGAKLQIDPKDPESPTSQLDVFAMDEELAIAIECKSSIEPKKDPRFQERIAKHAALKEPLVRAISSQFPSAERRRVVLSMFTANLQLSENDRKRAEALGISMFDQSDLSYYEALTRHLGPAARFQFLCDLIPGSAVRGLQTTLPAIKMKMGGSDCFLFSAHPEYLLKICYVSHRAKGKASDIDAYQRMVSRSRLAKIRRYISSDGIFPTNIVLSIQDAEILQFQRGKQEAEPGGSQFGWLHLTPTYKSAWVIDGQHRLFAHSGHPRASQAVLPVLAFAGLPASEQAELFIDINAEQRRVKKNLLQELFAELHWESSDPRERIAAVISKAIQQMDEDPESPLFGRILRTDEVRSLKQCISLTAVFKALYQQGIFVEKARKGGVSEFGPLWSDDNELALRRTKTILDSWLGAVRSKVPDWWDAGSGEGGGLAMNDGVTICLNTLRSVLIHLKDKGQQLRDREAAAVVTTLAPYAKALATFLGGFGVEERTSFRLLRGAQGQQRGLYKCLAGMKQELPDFDPPGLQKFLDQEGAKTTEKARTLIDRIETTLQSVILQELKQEYDGEQWWYDGVPAQVRKKVAERLEEDQGRRGGKEAYFDLIDYRTIASHNWQLFSNVLGLGSGSKDKRSEWIYKVNEVRKRAMHPSSGTGVSFEELQELDSIDQWLVRQASGKEGSDE